MIKRKVAQAVRLCALSYCDGHQYDDGGVGDSAVRASGLTTLPCVAQMLNGPIWQQRYVVSAANS